uniref:Cysteine-rich receptor-like protein kinase 2 n=1 Tax=Tanacetum cinerariifolium TaxID=118510 RepID=A0A6L2P692_TANCI|nr:cysteine-rich receptor-like protein kinase 2 [Tanacetum cinerariifolium]
MDNVSHTFTIFVTLIIIILQLVTRSEGEARAQVIKLICDNGRQNNQTLFVPNFVGMMEQIAAQMRTSRNATALVGTGPDSNNGIAQCYGDLSSDDCTLCYAEARTVLPSCFPHNGARIYLDGCFMRVQNYYFFQEISGPNDTIVCGNKTRKSRPFQDTVRQAVIKAVTVASQDSDYFAREQMLVSGTGNESVYVLADCWRTLNSSLCRACLENASASISKCLPWSEGRALNTGCFMRYSDTNFLNPVPVISSSSNRGKIIAIVVSVVSSVAVLAVAFMIVLYIWKRRYLQKKRKGSYDVKKLAKILKDSSLNFKYSTVEKATGSWDESNKLGQGGFGTVYKGVLSDGREIAVKRLYFNNKFRAADFYNEVNMISSVEHKNLVRLLGCSCSGPESILVYEYLPNMSLDRFIFDATKGKALNWEKRINILIGTAEGLVYLHENSKIRIIHRDIKAANILLDLRLRAKIADFGLARSFQDDKSHISTAIAGTLGYMAPEYLAHGQLTEKADVYSFGVLLLEVVTGMENNKSKTLEYTDSLVAIAWRHFQQNKVEEIFDPNLMMHIYPNSNYQEEAMKVVHIGLLCTQEDPSLRPSMSTVLKMLAKDDEPLPAPSNPPFMDEKTMELNDIRQNLRHYFNRDDSGSVATVSQSHIFPSSSHVSAIFIVLIIILREAIRSEADARSQVLRLTCENQRENNITLFMPNFVGMMEKVGAQMRTSRIGTTHVDAEPDSNYGLAQCYGDLSSDDCILCYAEARTFLPSCFPNNGGGIYLDGCFMRVQNYNFFKEISGPNDTIVCGNKTRKSRQFQDTVRQTVLKAVTDASHNSVYFAREEMLVYYGMMSAGVVNELVYVLADCWMTLNSSLCKACLENAYASITKCLPWSEGRALNTGCFMRYSDTDFLNPVPAAINSSSNTGNKLL